MFSTIISVVAATFLNVNLSHHTSCRISDESSRTIFIYMEYTALMTHKTIQRFNDAVSAEYAVLHEELRNSISHLSDAENTVNDVSYLFPDTIKRIITIEDFEILMNQMRFLKNTDLPNQKQLYYTADEDKLRSLGLLNVKHGDVLRFIADRVDARDMNVKMTVKFIHTARY